MESSSSSRRILSRNKPNEDDLTHHSSSRHYIKTENQNKSSSTRHSSTNSSSVSGAPIAKKEPIENVENMSISSSTTNLTPHQQQQQHNLAMNYINKEPFNEDIDIEECSLIQDLKWRTFVIDNFKAKIEEIKQLQLNPNKRSLVREPYKQALLLCSTVKKLNRVSHMRVNKARIQTHEEKNKIDEFHLELQNLLYEISHYKKEINKCHEFRSLDEEINLVSVEEFYSKSPLDISKPDETRNNEHKLKLARLDWELMERQTMLGRIKELENQIELRDQELKSKQNKLESLHPKLNQILDACKPTLEYFNTNFSDNYTFNEHVQYLPQSLYQFYMMMSAYRDTIDKEIKIEVYGDLDEAKRFNLNDSITFDDEDSDSDDENETENYKKKKSKSKINKKKSSNREKLFSCYPLSCKVTINVATFGQLTLELFYLSILKIISVRVEFSLYKDIQTTDSSLLNKDTLLDCLFPNDDGLESPNLSNKFLFNNLGIKAIEPHLKNLGRPYMWCQTLCGLFYENKTDNKFHSNNTDVSSPVCEDNNEEKMESDSKSPQKINQDDSDNESTEVNIQADNLNQRNESKLLEQVMNRLKSRFKARIVLQEIINSLKNQNVPSLKDSLDQVRFKIQSNLTSFKEISYDKFISQNCTKHLIDSSLSINENECTFYEINLSNQNATLQGQIVVNQDYPRLTPLFALNVNWKYDRNFTNDEAIRDMEREINIYRDNFIQDDTRSHYNSAKLLRKSSVSRIGFDDRNFDLFAKQIHNLLVCFDIYLESESYYLQSFEHQRVKLFPNSVKGRDRKRPYSYLASKDIFIQRMQFDENDTKK